MYLFKNYEIKAKISEKAKFFFKNAIKVGIFGQISGCDYPRSNVCHEVQSLITHNTFIKKRK